MLTGTRPREFRRLERELLGALVRVGAQALHRALLYEEQSSLATTLQSALLPQSLPRRDDVDLVGRYLPATKGVDVGGDWYDVLELGGSKLLLVVGDVMGKGVPAATLMGQMRSAVRTLAAVDPDPAAILSGLDQLAMGFALDDIVTLVIVSLDVDTGAAVIANAGHLSPLVFAPGAAGRAGHPGDPHVAADRGAGQRSAGQLPAARWPPGSGLLLLTDGLVEERDNDLDARARDAHPAGRGAAGRPRRRPGDGGRRPRAAPGAPRRRRHGAARPAALRAGRAPGRSGHQRCLLHVQLDTTPAAWRPRAGWCARPSWPTAANSTPSCWTRSCW